MRKILAFFLLALISTSVADSSTTSEQLRQLELRIRQLQTKMHNTRTQYGRLQRQLQHSEEDIGKVTQRLEMLHGVFTDKQHTLATLKKQQIALRNQLNTQRIVLARQIRTTYITGRQNYLKLWLNQEDPFTIGRMLTYHKYFNNARINQIVNIKNTLDNLTNLKQTIELEKTDLNQLVRDQSQKKEELELNYKERKKILTQLASTLENQAKKLKRLQDNKSKLEVLLGTLEETIKNIPHTQNFAQLKGQLPFPVQGKVTKRFGQQLVSHLKWQGLLIAAPQGKKITTIAAGRVVFAQWFRNLGLLIIIDHGDGYMSLYAHNQSLYVKTGDWLKTNDTIATVGNSGGRKISALYFEIRHQGIPQPPTEWLR
ncbi:peptidoglycan DD-metalloendopeptidase family protein [Candidatus Marithioploca araucensis]|uniref:Peptidoglycan DD-metalloendopeptidase family protein n=1 Tax=Candidatus Marithioploca araucensis TaxID=70273 RepID=A0ABT7VQL4_9GAMM|nr:peptidoglycan DD-metalloendopeptidase family protein [Candidatus Marithioploca araucensis]